LFKKITLYVARVSSQGTRDSAPCADCSQKMKELGVKKVVYTNAEGGITSCKVVDYNTTRRSTGRRLTL
tara:strand:+ start:241 stop:447 length:207 start_codon:yes stop_codon:yes gene_type:complete